MLGNNNYKQHSKNNKNKPEQNELQNHKIFKTTTQIH